jgi:hypothetical protein
MLRPIICGTMPNYVDSSQRWSSKAVQMEMLPDGRQSPEFPFPLILKTTPYGLKLQATTKLLAIQKITSG